LDINILTNENVDNWIWKYAMPKKYGTLFTKIKHIHYTSIPTVMLYLDSSSIYPLEQYKMYVHTVHIQCWSNSEVKWTFNNGDLPSNFIHQNNAIIGYNLKLEFGGKYQCYGKTENGEDFLAESWLKIGSKLILMLTTKKYLIHDM